MKSQIKWTNQLPKVDDYGCWVIVVCKDEPYSKISFINPNGHFETWDGEMMNSVLIWAHLPEPVNF
jgi:hypothetical protein